MHLKNKIELEEIRKQQIICGNVVTDSMIPLLPVGTNIVIDVNSWPLKRFDIIVFYKDGRLICHFLWNINKFIKPVLMQTRNLKNLGADHPISIEEYVGKVINHKLRFRDKLRVLASEFL